MLLLYMSLCHYIMSLCNSIICHYVITLCLYVTPLYVIISLLYFFMLLLYFYFTPLYSFILLYTLCLIQNANTVQRVLYTAIYISTFGKHTFWLLPNLTEDVSFLESFKPLYKHTVKGH